MNGDISIQTLINDELNKGREKREIKSWHASGLGSCLTSRFLERFGVPADEEFDDRTLRVFSVGNLFEDWVVNILTKQDGISCETQVRVEKPEWNLTGYADLVLSSEKEKILYEVKSKHSKAFWYMEKKKEGANKHHRMQIWSYLKTLGIEKGRIVYISKDDLAILEYPVSLYDEDIEEAVMAELSVMNASWKEQLPPPPIRWDFERHAFVKLEKTDWQYKYSRWKNQVFTQPEYFDTKKVGQIIKEK